MQNIHTEIQTEAKWKVEVTVELPYPYDFINFLTIIITM